MREQASPAHSYIVCEKLDVRLEACYYSFVKMKKRMVRSTQLYEVIFKCNLQFSSFMIMMQDIGVEAGFQGNSSF